MLQVKIQEPQRIIYEEAEKPTPAKEHAIVTVHAIGICGSDIHVYLGKNPVFTPPHVPGHEFGGLLKWIDPARGYFDIGTKVVVNPLINCTRCFYCVHGLEHLCENQIVIGGDIPGAMKEEISVPVKNLVRLPDDFDMILSPFVEPVAVLVHSLEGVKNSTILIIGLGTIGQCALLMCKQEGNRVLATDISELPLRLSNELGADFIFNFHDKEKIEKLAAFLRGDKIDLVVMTFCSRDTLDFAVEIVKKTGEIKLIGLPVENSIANTFNILIKELTLSSAYQYRDEEFEKAAQYIVDQKLNLSPLITKVYQLNEAAEAFRHKYKEAAVKIILRNE